MNGQGENALQELELVARLEGRRRHVLGQLLELADDRHAAILAALDAGATLTAVADRLAISRQALSRYLARRESQDGGRRTK